MHVNKFQAIRVFHEEKSRSNSVTEMGCFASVFNRMRNMEVGMQMSAFPVSMATNLKKMLETTTSNEQY